LLWQGEFAACLFATSSWSHAPGQAHPGGQCTGDSVNALYAKPLMLALPFWLRLWQCVAQLRCDGGNRWHALNALKYLTCLAVVGSSAGFRLVGVRAAARLWQSAEAAALAPARRRRFSD
jgi:hypothetical protein